MTSVCAREKARTAEDDGFTRHFTEYETSTQPICLSDILRDCTPAEFRAWRFSSFQHRELANNNKIEPNHTELDCHTESPILLEKIDIFSSQIFALPFLKKWNFCQVVQIIELLQKNLVVTCFIVETEKSNLFPRINNLINNVKKLINNCHFPIKKTHWL